MTTLDARADGMIEDLQSYNVTNSLFTPGPIIDTAFLKRLVFEVRWSLSAAPAVLDFTPTGSNDSAATNPDGNLSDVAVTGNLTWTGTNVTASLSGSGHGLIFVRESPRFITVNVSASGTFTGTISVRAFAFGK